MSLYLEEKECGIEETKKSSEYEESINQDFLNNTQSTHKIGLSSGVGMVLRRLSKKYFGDNPTNSMFEDACKSCLSELKVMASGNKEYEKAVNFLEKKIKEPIGDWDKVFLYLPTPTDPDHTETLVFPLSQVLPLVFKALKDDEAFSHHYNVSSGEKLDPAKVESDRVDRLKVLFTCLNSLSQGVCHHGVRNDLVFLLNKSYLHVDLIEDERGTVVSFFKDRLLEKFFACYKESSPDEKEKLDQALIAWMSEDNPDIILKLLDPDKTIHKELHALFISHGVDPNHKDVKLAELIQTAMPNITFSCDLNNYPIMNLASKIFQWRKEKNQPDRNKSLEWIKRYIKENRPWANSDSKSQKILADFYHLYAAHKNLEKHAVLLVMAGKMTTEELGSLKETCNTYFKSIAEKQEFVGLDEKILEEMKKVEKLVDAAKKDAAFDKIKDFFEQWFQASKNEDLTRLQQLYSMLLDEDMHRKIELPDQIIKDIFSKRDSETHKLILSPYQINRIFLHAILNKPEDWSDLFRDLLSETRELVEQDLNQDIEEEPSAFCLKSLLEQIAYLEAYSKMYLEAYSKVFSKVLPVGLEKKEEGSKEKGNLLERPENLILLPDNFKTFREWLQVAILLSKEQIDHFKSLYAIKIRVAINRLNESEAWDLVEMLGGRLDAILFYLPNQERKFFLKKLGHYKDFLNNHPILANAIVENYPIDVIEHLVPDKKFANTNSHFIEAPIYLASATNRSEVVIWLAEHGADPNKACGNGETPAHVAAKNGFVETLRALKKVNADLEAFDDNYKTPAHYAAEEGQVEVLQALRELGVNIGKPGGNGQTLAHYAITRGKATILREFKELIDQPDWDGQTPAHYAVKNGYIEMLETLKALGANLEARDNDGRTPADYATLQGHSKALELLVPQQECSQSIIKESEEKEVVPDSFKTLREWLQLAVSLPEAEALKLRSMHTTHIRAAIAALDDEEITLLMAEHSNRLDTVLLYLPPSDRKLFLEKLGDDRINALLYSYEKSDETTLLHRAIADNRPIDVIQWLNLKGKLTFELNDKGLMPIQYAVTRNRPDIVLWLLQKSSARADSWGYGASPLTHLAAENGSVPILKILKKFGANFEKDVVGSKAADIAATEGHVEALRFLKEEGVSVDQPNQHGRTPAHSAAQKGHVEVLRMLKEECDVDLQKLDSFGRTPAHYVIAGNHIEALRALKELGVNLCETNFCGQTLAHYAASKGLVEVLKVLGELGVNLHQPDDFGRTPEYEAMVGAHMNAQRMLEQLAASHSESSDQIPACSTFLSGKLQAFGFLATGNNNQAENSTANSVSMKDNSAILEG